MAGGSVNGRRRGRVAASLLAAGLLLLGLAWALGLRPLPTVPGTPLALVTDSPHVFSSCAGTGIASPLRVVVQDGALLVVAADTGQDQRLVWPFGFQARLVEGKGVLFDDHGAVLLRDGDAVTVGGWTRTDGSYLVCDASRWPA
jgi:hypothetical protein